MSWLAGNRYAVLPWMSGRGQTPGRGLNIIDTDTGLVHSVLPTTEPVDSASVSRDGKHIAYSLGGVHYSLIELPVNGAPVRPVSTSKLDESDGVWSAKTGKYAYVRGEEIHIRNREGTSDHIVVSLQDFPGARKVDVSSPAFSPDGERLAYYCGFAGDTYRSGIWISPANGGPPVSISQEELSLPAWSPDGKWIVAIVQGTSAPATVRVQPGSGSAPIQITQSVCISAAWSPDGQWISCFAKEGLLLISPDGSKTLNLGLGYLSMNAWSPDSKGLYVIKRDKDNRRFGFIDKAGSFRLISNLPADLVIGTPQWGPAFSLSPDGQAVMTSQEAATGDIWILDGLEAPPSFWRRMFGF
jgi:Tol biopolymer transport system component